MSVTKDIYRFLYDPDKEVQGMCVRARVRVHVCPCVRVRVRVRVCARVRVRVLLRVFVCVFVCVLRVVVWVYVCVRACACSNVLACVYASACAFRPMLTSTCILIYTLHGPLFLRPHRNGSTICSGNKRAFGMMSTTAMTARRRVVPEASLRRKEMKGQSKNRKRGKKQE